MSQNICVVSFDHWNYDKHIVTALKKKESMVFILKLAVLSTKTFGHVLQML